MKYKCVILAKTGDDQMKSVYVSCHNARRPETLAFVKFPSNANSLRTFGDVMHTNNLPGMNKLPRGG